MSKFVRRLLPDPEAFYESEGHELKGAGQWRTTDCRFHGGSDSMRVNLETGGFVCMNCGEHGGDVVDYRMRLRNEEFSEAARALGAWREGGAPRKQTTISAAQALALLERESLVVAVAAANVANGVLLSDEDRTRVLQAAGRIASIREEHPHAG
jgi:hypothetical protein